MVPRRERAPGRRAAKFGGGPAIYA